MAVPQTAPGITEAFHYLRAAPIVTWSLVYIALTYTLVAVAGALGPGFVREVLRVGERNVVIFVAPAGIGVVAGAAFPAVVATVAVTAFFFGVSYAFVTVPAMTVLQEELRDDIRGRVFGVLNMLVSVFSLLPLLLVGPVADLWGVAPVFVGFAAIVGVVWIAGKTTRERRQGGRG